MSRQLKPTWLTAVLLLFSSVAWSQPRDGSTLEALQFMQGKWVGEGTSELGQGGGYFSFEPDLLGKVWIRRNHAEYPGANNGPAAVHEDLMIVYVDPDSKQTRAFYSDTERHTIHYTVSFSDDSKTATFLGEMLANQPRYRLTYVRLAPGRLSVILEMAPAEHPDQFKKIVEGLVRKIDGQG